MTIEELAKVAHATWSSTYDGQNRNWNAIALAVARRVLEEAIHVVHKVTYPMTPATELAILLDQLENPK